jgi:chromosome segregation ATPase
MRTIQEDPRLIEDLHDELHSLREQSAKLKDKLDEVERAEADTLGAIRLAEKGLSECNYPGSD